MSTEFPPLNDYLDQLFEKQQEYIRDHNSNESFRSQLFDFNRALKGHPEMRHLTAKEALSKIEKWMKIRGREWTDFMEIHCSADGRAEFISTWENVRFPIGEDGERLMRNALHMADSRPIPFHSQVLDDPDYHRFLSFTYWLQMFVAPSDCIVPCRKLGELLGPSHTTISKYRCWAGLGKGKSDGLLKETRKFIYSGGVKKATCCKFLIEKLPQPWSTIDWWK
jgi:hypothetical protein